MPPRPVGRRRDNIAAKTTKFLLLKQQQHEVVETSVWVAAVCVAAVGVAAVCSSTVKVWEITGGRETALPWEWIGSSSPEISQ